MPTLSLCFKGKILQKYHIEKGDSVKIGRRNHNDIVIDNSSVSGKHAHIQFKKDQFWIKDLKSTNGTFVNEHLIIAPHELKDGDLITIGKHEITFYEFGCHRTGI